MRYIKLLLILTIATFAEIPKTINYQGFLTNRDGSRVNGDIEITFSIYNTAINGRPLWREKRVVKVSNGFYSIILGEKEPINIDFDTQYWLGVKIGDEVEMKPRQKLASVPYSLDSLKLKKDIQKMESSILQNIDTNITTLQNDLNTKLSEKMDISQFDNDRDGKIDSDRLDIDTSSIFKSSNTNASGQYSLAWGYRTKAKKDYSTAWGYRTEATEGYATSWGWKTRATAVGATAFGRRTIADQMNQLAIGEFNRPDQNGSLFSIGNGTDEYRSDIVVVTKKEANIFGGFHVRGKRLRLDIDSNRFAILDMNRSQLTIARHDVNISGFLYLNGKDVNRSISELQKNLEKNSSNLQRNLESNVSYFQSRIETIESNVSSLQKNLESNVSSLRKDLETGIANLRKKHISDMEKVKRELNSTVSEHQKILEGLDNRIRKNNQTISYLEKDIDKLDGKINTKMTTKDWDSNEDGKIDENRLEINPSHILNGKDAEISGLYALAWGYETKASGMGATAFGLGTVADGHYQTSIGRYNQPGVDALFVVGNGENENSRSNIFLVSNSKVEIDGQFFLNGTDFSDLSTRLTGLEKSINKYDKKISDIDTLSSNNREDITYLQQVASEQNRTISDIEMVLPQKMDIGDWDSDGNGEIDLEKLEKQDLASLLKSQGVETGGENSLAWGYRTKATKDYSTAWGYRTEATEGYTTSWGWKTRATAVGATAFGKGTIADQMNQLAIGEFNRPDQNGSLFSIGNGTDENRSDILNVKRDRVEIFGRLLVNGQDIGDRNYILNSDGSQNPGLNSLAWGKKTKAYGIYSTAFGEKTEAIGLHSTAFGYGSRAIGGYSIASGYKTTATGGMATAFGAGTIADQTGELAIGLYNRGDIPGLIFVIGNGVDESHRQNGLEFYMSGNMNIAGSLHQSSDIRLKRDIHKIEKPLEKIEKIKGVTFYWRDEKKNSNRQMGVIAQDVEKVAPELVSKDSNGYLTVSYPNMVALLIEAIKELKNENEKLKKALQSAGIEVE
ncbi:MAG TPA: hypothetical protein EYG60_00770 [Campylobacterales bacterium]|nr:hypothetical protein [Campylobacterales bacterium]